MCSNCSNCTIALHQRIVLMFVETRSEDLDLLPLWELEFSIDPDKLGPLIARYRRLSIRLKPYRPPGRSPVKNGCFIRRKSMYRIAESSE